MSDKMNTMRAVESMAKGGVIFASDVEDMTLQILNGMVVNSELCKCQHGEFTWYFAWAQKSSECEADKANQMAKSVQPKR